MELKLPEKLLQGLHNFDKFDLSKRILYAVPAGSRAYGTEVEGSDYDYIVVAIPPREFLYGIKEWDQSHFINKEDGYDIKLFSLREYVKLLIQGNPNVLESIWSPSPLIKDPFPGCDTNKMTDLQREFEKRYVRNREALSSKLSLRAMKGYVQGNINIASGRGQQNPFRHLAHALRMALVAERFYKDGRMAVHVGDNKRLIQAVQRGGMTLDGVQNLCNEILSKLITEECPLPDEPDRKFFNNHTIEMCDMATCLEITKQL